MKCVNVVLGSLAHSVTCLNVIFRLTCSYMLKCSPLISGSLAHSVTDVDVALAGASGGCYALIGAHIASVIVVSTD